jgi:hypothetical protein
MITCDNCHGVRRETSVYTTKTLAAHSLNRPMKCLVVEEPPLQMNSKGNRGETVFVFSFFEHSVSCIKKRKRIKTNGIYDYLFF